VSTAEATARITVWIRLYGNCCPKGCQTFCKLQIVARSHCWFVSYVSCVWLRHRPWVSTWPFEGLYYRKFTNAFSNGMACSSSRFGVRKKNPTQNFNKRPILSQELVKLRIANLADRPTGPSYIHSYMVLSQQKPIKNLGDKGGDVGVARDCSIFWIPPIIPGTGKAMNFKKICMHCTHSQLDRNKRSLKISGEVAVGALRDSQKLSGHSYKRTHSIMMIIISQHLWSYDLLLRCCWLVVLCTTCIVIFILYFILIYAFILSLLLMPEVCCWCVWAFCISLSSSYSNKYTRG